MVGCGAAPVLPRGPDSVLNTDYRPVTKLLKKEVGALNP